MVSEPPMETPRIVARSTAQMLKEITQVFVMREVAGGQGGLAEPPNVISDHSMALGELGASGHPTFAGPRFRRGPGPG